MAATPDITKDSTAMDLDPGTSAMETGGAGSKGNTGGSNMNRVNSAHATSSSAHTTTKTGQEVATSSVRTQDPRLHPGASTQKIAVAIIKLADNEAKFTRADYQKFQVDQALLRRRRDFRIIHKTQEAVDMAMREDPGAADSLRRQKQYQDEQDQSVRHRSSLAASLEGQILDSQREEINASIKRFVDSRDYSQLSKSTSEIGTRLDRLEGRCQALEDENTALRSEVKTLKQRDEETAQAIRSSQEDRKVIEAQRAEMAQFESKLSVTENTIDQRLASLHATVEQLQNETTVNRQSADSSLAAFKDLLDSESSVSENKVSKIVRDVLASDNQTNDRSRTDRESVQQTRQSSHEETSTPDTGTKSPAETSMISALKLKLQNAEFNFQNHKESVDRLNANCNLVWGICQDLDKRIRSNTQKWDQSQEVCTQLLRDVSYLHRALHATQSMLEQSSNNTLSPTNDQMYQPGINPVTQSTQGSSVVGQQRNWPGQMVTANVAPNVGHAGRPATGPISPSLPEGPSRQPVSSRQQPAQVIGSPAQNSGGWQNPNVHNNDSDRFSPQVVEKMVRVHEHRLNNLTLGDLHKSILHQVTQTYRYPEDVARQLKILESLPERVAGIEREIERIKAGQSSSSDLQPSRAVATLAEPAWQRHQIQSLDEETANSTSLVASQLSNLPGDFPSNLRNQLRERFNELKRKSAALGSVVTEDDLFIRYTERIEITRDLTHLTSKVNAAHLTDLMPKIRSLREQVDDLVSSLSSAPERLQKLENQFAVLSKYDHLLESQNHQVLKNRVDKIENRGGVPKVIADNYQFLKDKVDKLEVRIQSKEEPTPNQPSSVVEVSKSSPTISQQQTTGDVQMAMSYAEDQIEQISKSLAESKQVYDKRIEKLEQALEAVQIAKIERKVDQANQDFLYAFRRIGDFEAGFADVRGDLKLERQRIDNIEGKRAIAQPPLVKRMRIGSDRSASESSSRRTDRKSAQLSLKRRKRTIDSDSDSD